MITLKSTFEKIQQMVDVTARLLSKKVTFHSSGGEIELDQQTLDSIGDSLVQLIRNAVDHGIESKEKRIAAGKSETGNIWLFVTEENRKLIIEVKDDGRGMESANLVNRAIEIGILRPGTVLSVEKSIDLIFQPGFSTKREVSEISGRGVGMSVVKTNIEKLLGEIEISTTPGFGSVFKISLPLKIN